ncbi:hypothetical protein DL93DRAFT_2079249 [Clavulina sp. PMI_390]|nr:hypothetical protein DL93DRAFT_2079249 [Clavulina sp. PMI_390]
MEEKKKTISSRLLHASGSSGSVYSDTSSQNRGTLKLKGRIYVRHIKRVIDTSVAGELSLTIDMEDDRLESFVLVFKNRSVLESWRTAIIGLVTMFQDAMGRPRAGTPSGIYALSNSNGEMEEFGISGKAARILSVGSAGGETQASGSSRITSQDSIIASSQRSTMSSTTSNSNSRAGMSSNGPMSNASTANTTMYHQPPPPTVTPRSANGASNSLTPVAHTPLDLICVISVPPPSVHVPTASLKTRVIKTTLEFVIASMGAKDRLSLVTFEVGVQGRIRKTPFLSLGRAQSRQRLASFVDSLSERKEGDEFLVPSGRDEKTDVVTAVNHGLDVVLQRKHKNPISGLILVSDAADSTRRAQMDLVLARTEAANIPIHSFGYGKSHDPASLWLMSNHTSGTYTFVREWYDLRDCIAGCVGGMMSIALTQLKLHMRVVDSMRFKMRKVSGAPHAIVSTDGQDVHVDIGELRYGEKKEMLVELELDNASDQSMHTHGSDSPHGGGGAGNATDQFVRNLGALSLGGSTANLVDGIMDRMIDEVPVFELDGSFYDPAVGRTASRLANPVLLTVTLIPAQSSHRPSASASISDVVIVRRRMELLASDMITRALVLIARKNYAQAQKIIEETKRILQTVLQNVSQGVSPLAGSGSAGGGARSRKELLSLSAVRTLQSMLQDLQTLIDALEDNVDLFQHDHRNFGAQQAMILRDQKSWTGRTPTEKLFWVADNSLELMSRSHDWVSSYS